MSSDVFPCESGEQNLSQAEPTRMGAELRITPTRLGRIHCEMGKFGAPCALAPLKRPMVRGEQLLCVLRPNLYTKPHVKRLGEASGVGAIRPTRWRCAVRPLPPTRLASAPVCDVDDRVQRLFADRLALSLRRTPLRHSHRERGVASLRSDRGHRAAGCIWQAGSSDSCCRTTPCAGRSPS
jgi:hypothetical protein